MIANNSSYCLLNLLCIFNPLLQKCWPPDEGANCRNEIDIQLLKPEKDCIRTMTSRTMTSNNTNTNSSRKQLQYVLLNIDFSTHS